MPQENTPADPKVIELRLSRRLLAAIVSAIVIPIMAVTIMLVALAQTQQRTFRVSIVSNCTECCVLPGSGECQRQSI